MPVKKENTQGSSLLWGVPRPGVTRSSASQSQGKPLFFPLWRMTCTMQCLHHPLSPKFSWDFPDLTILNWLGLCLAENNGKILLIQVRCLYVSRNKKSGAGNLELLQWWLYSWSTMFAHGLYLSVTRWLQHLLASWSHSRKEEGWKANSSLFGCFYLYLRREVLPTDLHLHIKRIMSHGLP